MSIESYKEIGVFANYFARVEDATNDIILFQPLDLVFTAGYLSMEHYTIDETFVAASNRTDITFAIPVGSINQIVPEWKNLLSFITEFISN